VLFCSAHELALFGMFHLKARHPAQKAVLSDAAIAGLQDPAVVDGNVRHSLAWSINDNQFGYRTLLAQGGTYDAQAWLLLVPSENLVVVVLANSGNVLATRPIDRILSVLLPAYRDNLAKAAQPVPGGSAPAVATVAAAATPLAGEWSGEIQTHRADVPLALAITSGGEVEATLGRQPAVKLTDVRIRDDRLTGRMPGDLGVTYASGSPCELRLELYRQENSLHGAAVTHAAPGRDGPRFPFWVELKRSGQKPGSAPTSAPASAPSTIPTRAERVAERVSATTIHGWNTGRLLLHGGSLLASAARPNPQAAHFWDHGGLFFRRGPDGTWAEAASLPHDAYTTAAAGDGSLWAAAPVGYEDVRILRSPPPGDPARLQEVRRAPCSYLGAGVSPEGNFLLLSAESGDSTAGRPNAVAAVFFDHATGAWHQSRIPTPEGRYGYEGIVLRGKSAIAVLQASLTDREHPDVKGSEFSWRHVRLARCADLTKGEWTTRGWLLPRDGRTFVHDLVAGPDGRLLLSLAHVAAGSHEELLRIERTPHQVARISEDLSVESFPTGLDVSAARLLVDRRGGIHLVGRQGSGSLRLFDLDPATFRPTRERELAGTERLADYVIHTLCPERHGGERDGDTIHLLGAPSPKEPPGRERGEVELWHVSFRLDQ
jgi:hypothetical protein